MPGLPLSRLARRFPVARLLVLAEVAVLARDHLSRLEPDERRRLVALIRRGRGRPGNLTQKERRELARLVAKVEPRLLARSALERVTGFKLP